MKTPKDTSPKAVVLLSGGLDSAVVAASSAEDGFAIHALTVDYGQRHFAELDAARERIAVVLGVEGEELIFTSGGTEANNSAIFGALPPGAPSLR